jgi:hypothetical protein
MAPSGSPSPLRSNSSIRPRPSALPGAPLDPTETTPDRPQGTPPSTESLEPKWLVAIDAATD